MEFSSLVKIYGPTRDIAFKSSISNIKITITYRTLDQVIRIYTFKLPLGQCTVKLITPNRDELKPLLIRPADDHRDIIQFLVVPPLTGIVENNQYQILVHHFLDTLLPLHAVQVRPLLSSTNSSITDI
jgi:hypothetical protein